VLVNPQDPATVYVGTDHAGLYKSTDCGATWTMPATGTNADAITGGAGAIMFRDNMKPLESDSFLYEPFLHARVLGEKDLSLALALGEAHSVELPLATIALERLADGLGVPHIASTTKE